MALRISVQRYVVCARTKNGRQAVAVLCCSGNVTALFVADPRRYFMGEVSYNIADSVMEGIKNEIINEGKAAISHAEKAAKLKSIPFENKIIEGDPAEEILVAWQQYGSDRSWQVS